VIKFDVKKVKRLIIWNGGSIFYIFTIYPLAILWNSPCKMQKLQIKYLVMHEENEIKYKTTLQPYYII